MPLADLGALLSPLMQARIEGAPFPKLRYGSAGNLYPVQAYVWAEAGRVEGLPAGAWYYDPAGHGLVRVSEADGADISRMAGEAGFAVFLVAHLAAIAPLYGRASWRFSVLEAGLMTQLLAEAAAGRGLALSPAAAPPPRPCAGRCGSGKATGR